MRHPVAFINILYAIPMSFYVNEIGTLEMSYIAKKPMGSNNILLPKGFSFIGG